MIRWTHEDINNAIQQAMRPKPVMPQTMNEQLAQLAQIKKVQPPKV